MNTVKRWLISLILCLTWLLLCGFNTSENRLKTTVDSAGVEYVKQAVTEQAERAKILKEWENKVLADVDSYVNVREEANTDSKIAGRLYEGDGGIILERADGWTKISSGNLEGYVSNEYLLFGMDAYEAAQEKLTMTVTVNTEMLRIRDEAAKDSKIIMIAEEGSKFAVIDEEPAEEDMEEDASEEEEAEENGSEEEEISEEEPEEDALSADSVSGNDAGQTVSGEEDTAAETEEEEAEDPGEWICVQYEEDKTGYVAAEYVIVEYEFGEGMTIEEVKKKEAEERKEKLKQQLAAMQAEGDELKLLAALIQAESGNQPYEGKVAVGAVVMNRVRSSRYPNSITGVVYEAGQFSPVANGTLARYYTAGPSGTCIQAAQEALNGYTNVGTYTHFRRGGSLGDNSIVIGNHVFY